jgi:hypothetical protein
MECGLVSKKKAKSNVYVVHDHIQALLKQDKL